MFSVMVYSFSRRPTLEPVVELYVQCFSRDCCHVGGAADAVQFLYGFVVTRHGAFSSLQRII